MYCDNYNGEFKYDVRKTTYRETGASLPARWLTDGHVLACYDAMIILHNIIVIVLLSTVVIIIITEADTRVCVTVNRRQNVL